MENSTLLYSPKPSAKSSPPALSKISRPQLKLAPWHGRVAVLAYPIRQARPGSSLIFSDVGRQPDELRIVGFVVGSDCPDIHFGDLLEMSNTHALTFNRPGAFLAGLYSPNDELEYLGPGGQNHRTTAAIKLAFVRPEHFVCRLNSDGAHALADRVLIELDVPRQTIGNIIRPAAWIDHTRSGTVISEGWEVDGLLGKQVTVKPRCGSLIERKDKTPILSARIKDLIFYEHD